LSVLIAGYVPLFGAPSYDIANEREGDIPFEEQLRGIENVIKQGKVGAKKNAFSINIRGGKVVYACMMWCVVCRYKHDQRRRGFVMAVFE
jgi:hypothetical protein